MAQNWRWAMYSVQLRRRSSRQTNKLIGQDLHQNQMSDFQIITFYEFRSIAADELPHLRDNLRRLMREHSIKGTIILAEEGFNATVSGSPAGITRFISAAEQVLDTEFKYKSSIHRDTPFRRVD